MSRVARQLSESGFYHIMFRGINHQNIFEDDKDYRKLMNTLAQLKKEMSFEIHAYCLMSNHVHLLIKERELGDISQIMKRLLTQYAMYFNRKYQRSGSLIAGRYKSKTVELDEYFIPLIVYIHQNPLKAGIISKIEDYPYSSYQEYVKKAKLVETKLSEDLLGKKQWAEKHQVDVENIYDPTDKKKKCIEEIRENILELLDGVKPHEIVSWEKQARNEIVHKLKDAGLSVREIERITGIARGVVQNI